MPPDAPDELYWSAQCGRQIRALREALKMTQGHLGSQVGMTDQGISNIERGLVNIPTETLGKIAKVLELSPAQLYGEVQIRELGLRVWLRRDRAQMVKDLKQMADKLEVLSM